MTATFSLADATTGGPCTWGLDQASTLLDPACEYTVADLIEAGLARESVAWAILHKSKTSDEVLDGLRRWAGLLDVEVAPDCDCDTASAALQRGCSGVLRQLVRSGTPHNQAVQMTLRRYFEAMVSAFA